MVKSYQKWTIESTIGIITSPEGDIIYDEKGKLVYTSSLQSVGIWDLKKSEEVILYCKNR